MSKRPEGEEEEMGFGQAGTLLLDLGSPAPNGHRPVAGAGESTGVELDFDDVYRRYFAHVVRWVRALGGLSADGDDLAQEVFVVVNRRLPTFSGGSLSAWLYGITRKTVSDYRRRAFMRRMLSGLTRSLDDRAVERSAGWAADGAPGSGHATAQDKWEDQRTLAQVLARMGRTRRVTFQLFEIEGYSGKEISELERIPLATVHTRLFHARREFKRLLADAVGEADGVES